MTWDTGDRLDLHLISYSILFSRENQCNLVVSGSVKRVQIDNTVLVEKEELKKIRDPEEFTCVIEERMES